MQSSDFYSLYLLLYTLLRFCQVKNDPFYKKIIKKNYKKIIKNRVGKRGLFTNTYKIVKKKLDKTVIWVYNSITWPRVIYTPSSIKNVTPPSP